MESTAVEKDNYIHRNAPDPSILTTQQLLREVAALRELLEVKLIASELSGKLNREVIETRLDGMDKAIRLLQDTADKFPDRIDEKIKALAEVHEQKFHSIQGTHEEKFFSIQTQFKERDVRTEQSSKDSKVAVDAALQAAKEAVGEQNKSSGLAISKSENATMKQIDQLGLLIQTMTKGFDDKIDDLKERLTRAEGKGQGMTQGWGYLVAAVMLIIAIASFSMKNRDPVATPQYIYVPTPAGSMMPAAPAAQSVIPR